MRKFNTERIRITSLEKRIEKLEKHNASVKFVIIMVTLSMVYTIGIFIITYLGFDEKLQNVPHKVCRNETVRVFDILPNRTKEYIQDSKGFSVYLNCTEIQNGVCYFEKVKEVCEWS